MKFNKVLIERNIQRNRCFEHELLENSAAMIRV